MVTIKVELDIYEYRLLQRMSSVNIKILVNYNQDFKDMYYNKEWVIYLKKCSVFSFERKILLKFENI